MYKVKCVGCGDIGYTAAPKFVKCSACGGEHKVIPLNKADMKTSDNNAQGLFYTKSREDKN